jgi:glutamyl-tRNA synthetase
MSVRTRFAPSPTGFLHVGSVRTALYAWLYARHHQGQFILRIEDTDEERSTQASVDAILSGMEWLGLTWDEGPYYQSQRTARYVEIAQQLLANGQAYYCHCSKERLETLRETQLAARQKPRYDGHCRELHLSASDTPHVIRFKNPAAGAVVFKDEVYGEISVNNSELDDLILVRSDGNPTYNFAVVVDDWDMQITHVIRGDDHINNTPRQINLYQALQAPIPTFAHLPMILGEDGKRLSKRHGAVNVLEFKSLGILPHALLNYLVRLGWSHGDQEIFSLEEMIHDFDLAHVSRGVSSFNYEKLYWLNQHYQKHGDPRQVAHALAWYFEQQGVDYTTGPSLVNLLAVQAERYKTLADLVAHSHCYYQDALNYDDAAVKKHLRPVILEPLAALYTVFTALQNWNKGSIQESIDSVCAQFDLNFGKLAQPLRVAVTGSSNSPSIDDTLVLIGQPRVLARMAVALQMIRERKEVG